MSRVLRSDETTERAGLALHLRREEDLAGLYAHEPGAERHLALVDDVAAEEHGVDAQHAAGLYRGSLIYDVAIALQLQLIEDPLDALALNDLQVRSAILSG